MPKSAIIIENNNCNHIDQWLGQTSNPIGIIARNGINATDSPLLISFTNA